jgi:(p)ppGpp synthase/HD superfamily hydrolase
MAEETIKRELIEKAIDFLTLKFANPTNRTKPVLFHSLHVGFCLYDKGYKIEVVLAGFLHDIIEDAKTTKEEIAEIFGSEVAKLVAVNSKDDNIKDKKERKHQMILNCIRAGENALIVKAADILENYTYHPTIKWQAGVDYLNDVCKILFTEKPKNFNDEIFTILKEAYNTNN